MLQNKMLKDAEEKATKLFECNFSLRAFTSIYISMYFSEEEAGRVFFHKNLLVSTEYSTYLQEQIEQAIVEQIEENGFTNKSKIYNAVNESCVAKEFEIIERYGRPHTSGWRTFDLEYKRVMSKILQKYNYIKKSNTPTKEMEQTFKLRDKKHILYDARILEEGRNRDGKEF